jgi:hypothetical protein
MRKYRRRYARESLESFHGLFNSLSGPLPARAVAEPGAPVCIEMSLRLG